MAFLSHNLKERERERERKKERERERKTHLHDLDLKLGKVNWTFKQTFLKGRCLRHLPFRHLPFGKAFGLRGKKAPLKQAFPISAKIYVMWKQTALGPIFIF
jgi:hypothetical protein